MIQTTTTNLLHFEDLEPRMFENIYTNILIASDEYKDIKTYGIKGSDEGIDIFCIEKLSSKRLYIQCKRYQKLTISEIKKIVDRISKTNKNIHGQIIRIVASCNISKKVQDEYEEYAASKGFYKAEFFGQIVLDGLLHTKFENIKERFLGTNNSIEEIAKKRLNDYDIGKDLVDKKLLRPINAFTPATIKRILENPTNKFISSEVLIRSILDRAYPNAYEENDPQTWFSTFIHDIYNDGIQVYLRAWDYATILISPLGEWCLEKDFDANKHGNKECLLKLNVDIIGRIPFHNIVKIREEGDSNYDCPHIFCRFNDIYGPINEFCYEYHDYDSHKRYFFENNRRAFISDEDFLWLLNKSIRITD